MQRRTPLHSSAWLQVALIDSFPAPREELPSDARLHEVVEVDVVVEHALRLPRNTQDGLHRQHREQACREGIQRRSVGSAASMGSPCIAAAHFMIMPMGDDQASLASAVGDVQPTRKP